MFAINSCIKIKLLQCKLNIFFTNNRQQKNVDYFRFILFYFLEEEIYSFDPASYLLVEQQSNEDLGHQNKRIKCDNTENSHVS